MPAPLLRVPDPFNIRMNIWRDLVSSLLSFFLSGVTPRKDISLSVIDLIRAISCSFNVNIGPRFTPLRPTLA